MRKSCLIAALLAAAAIFAAADGNQKAAASSTSSDPTAATTTTPPPRSRSTQLGRQSSAISLLGSLGSLVPGLVTNVAPLMLLFGLGALMAPQLGGLLRESRRSAPEPLALVHQQQPANSLQALIAQYAQRPLQPQPQDIYYFTRRSLPSSSSSFGLSRQGLKLALSELGERVVRALDEAGRQHS